MPVHLRIVTRRKVVFDSVVESVQAPGFHGEFGVLPGHVRYLTLVRPGRVLVHTDAGVEGFIVGIGFAEAGPDHLTILVDHCESLKDVDVAKAREDLTQAESELLKLAEGSAEWELAERRAWLARARIGAV